MTPEDRGPARLAEIASAIGPADPSLSRQLALLADRWNDERTSLHHFAKVLTQLPLPEEELAFHQSAARSLLRRESFEVPPSFEVPDEDPCPDINNPEDYH